MKRILSVLTALALCFGGAPLSLAESSETIYYSENFNSFATGASPSTLDMYVGENTKMYIEEKPSASDKSVALEGSANNLFVQSTFREALQGEVFISFDVSFDTINSSQLMIELRNKAGVSTVAARLKNGVVTDINGNIVSKYIENKFYTVEMSLDLENGKMSMWFGGKRVMKDAVLSSLSDLYFVRAQLSQIKTYSKMNIDNILIKSGLERTAEDNSEISNGGVVNVKKDMANSEIFYSNRKNVLIGGEKKTMALSPFEEDETLYIPLRSAMKYYGAGVEYNASENSVDIALGSDKYTIKDQTVLKNNQQLVGEYTIKNVNSSIYISSELLAEMCGKKLFFDKSNGIAVLSDREFSWQSDLELLNEAIAAFIYDDYTGEELVKMVKEKNPDNSHPRVMADKNTFENLKELIKTDEFAKKGYESVIKSANQVINQPASVYELPDGLRLLEVSRRVLDRVVDLSLAYNLTGDEKYAERAWLELYVCSYFPNWNEKHFLDVAEMSAAFAIGYDWLYSYLDDNQRAQLRKAMINYGLLKVMDDYNKNERERTYRWSESVPPNNWTMVCNGGLAMSALALIGDADGEEEKLCGEVLSNGLVNVRRALTLFAPSGSYSEGANYWNYATRYYAFYMNSLETAIGSDLGYFDVPGMRNTVGFVESLNGPAGYYNFSDAASNTGVLRPPQMIWFANKLGKPYYASVRKQPVLDGKFTAGWEDLIYYRAEDEASDQQMPLDKYSDVVETMTMRSSYEDDALYVGFHNGSNAESHTHLDLGGFILDSQGERFICELGYDDYNLTGNVFDRYRYRAEGHNTLVINPDENPDQRTDANAKIISYDSKKRGAYAIADLTSAYNDAKSVKRGVMMTRRSVIITDEISLKSKSDVWWFAHTDSDVKISSDGKSATLTKKGKKLKAQLLSDGEFTVMDAAPFASTPEVKGQNQNIGYRKLAIHLENVEDTTISVVFSNYYDSDDRKEIVPLSDWAIEDGEIEYAAVNSISVDGKEIEGFNPDVYSYTMSVPMSQSEKNVVTAPGEVTDLRENNKPIGTVLVKASESGKTDKNYIITFERERLINVPDWLKRIPVSKYTASAEPQAENSAANAFDESLDTRWASEGHNTMVMDLGSKKDIFAVGIAFWKGNERVSTIKIEASDDGEEYNTVYEGESSGTTEAIEVFDIDGTNARYIRVHFYGTNVGTWNSILDLSVLQKG